MWRICLAVLAGLVALGAGGAAFAVNAIANATLDQGSGAIREFRPGDGFDIVGDCLALARAAHDVRVVLTLADVPGNDGTGYRNVLATEQTVDKDALHVRVPEMPEMSHHTYRVKVFAMEGDAAQACEAGQIRIV